MPFGLVFGALYFGIVCSWLGLRLLGAAAGSTRAAGGFLILLGISLALGLLLGRAWARWAGLACGLLGAAFGIRQVALEAATGDFLVLFGSLATAALLAVPSTGAARETQASRTGGRAGVLELATAAGFLGLVATSWWSTAAPEAKPETHRALPASSISRRVRWTDFGSGLERAASERKPVLATFVTDWCPYCTKMAKGTWRNSSVTEAMADVIAVKINAEERNARNGYKGMELAARYGIRGYPAQLLLDSEGRVISRADGYLSAGQLLDWLDDTLGQPGGGGSTTSARRTKS